MGVTKNGKNFLAPSVESPSVQTSRVQASKRLSTPLHKKLHLRPICCLAREFKL